MKKMIILISICIIILVSGCGVENIKEETRPEGNIGVTIAKTEYLKFNVSSNINIYHDGIKIDKDLIEISSSEIEYFLLNIENVNKDKLICVEFDSRIILDVEIDNGTRTYLYKETIPREYIFQDKYSYVNCYSLEKVERFNLKIETEYEFKEGINETTIYIKLFQ